jgi:anti-anti-sigma factor
MGKAHIDLGPAANLSPMTPQGSAASAQPEPAPSGAPPAEPSRPLLALRAAGHLREASVQGDLDHGSVRSVAELVAEAALRDDQDVALSLARARHLDGEGVAALVHLHAEMALHGRRVYLIDVPPSVREVLERTKLNELVSLLPP